MYKVRISQRKNTKVNNALSKRECIARRPGMAKITVGRPAQKTVAWAIPRMGLAHESHARTGVVCCFFCFFLFDRTTTPGRVVTAAFFHPLRFVLFRRLGKPQVLSQLLGHVFLERLSRTSVHFFEGSILLFEIDRPDACSRSSRPLLSRAILYS